jgi:DNA-binding Lrp family transcriptional regulator
MTTLPFRLLNEFQRGFPLCPAPYAKIAQRLAVPEQWVLDALYAFREQGVVSRVGAVFAPRAIGVSALAALCVPEARLEQIAEHVSSFAEVNHNYEREHAFNLWFVATASDETTLTEVLRRIEAECGCGRLLVLPLLEEYRIDLGFELDPRKEHHGPSTASTKPAPIQLSAAERRLVLALQAGIEVVHRPYQALAEAAELSEEETLRLLDQWIRQGIIRRFGVILRHRELGYRANAMVVWDVPDAVVGELGTLLAKQPGVTLCYRRQRALPDWPYNLFCMIHGRSRDAVLERLESLRTDCGLTGFDSRVLFSRRRFKQRGAFYVAPKALAYG